MNTPIISHTHFDALRRLDCEKLQAELDRASVVPAAEVPVNVVTLHSQVEYEDETAGDRRVVTVVYPHEADVANGRISVLAPVGAALLGLSTGQTIDWEFPHGVCRRLRVLKVAREAR